MTISIRDTWNVLLELLIVTAISGHGDIFDIDTTSGAFAAHKHYLIEHDIALYLL